MNTRFVLWFLSVIVGLTFWPASATCEPDAPKGKPNILFIMSDDHATHAISAYGSKINITPNIDRLAASGMRFTNAFCENSLCSPSRAAMLTGTMSCRNGVPDLSTPLPLDRTTFPALLGSAGYQTAMIGKWHLHRDPTGFDHWDMLPGQGDYRDPEFISAAGKRQVKGYVTDIITDKCIDWLEHRDPDRPFLLFCHHKAPHRPWQPDAKHAAMYADADIPLPATFDDDYATRSDAARRQTMSIENDLSSEDLKVEPPTGLTDAELKRWKYQRYMKDYLRCIASVDDNIGRLLDYLDTHGLADNTIVIYTSDQGFFLGDHGWYDKRFMYEESLRMPLLARVPGITKPGSMSAAFVQNIDFAPTLLHLAGAPIPKQMQGVSIRPLLSGQTPADWRKSILYHYYEEPGPHNVAAHFGVRTDRYKLIRFYSAVKAWELYDLKNDPNELKNVYDDPEYTEVLTDLKAELSRLKTYYGDKTPEVVDAKTTK